jgi:hypothetical protein
MVKYYFQCGINYLFLYYVVVILTPENISFQSSVFHTDSSCLYIYVSHTSMINFVKNLRVFFNGLLYQILRWQKID